MFLLSSWQVERDEAEIGSVETHWSQMGTSQGKMLDFFTVSRPPLTDQYQRHNVLLILYLRVYVMLQSIVHNNLISPNVEERIDAARHLGALRVGDTMVLYALRERLKNETEERVVYESAKALASLGWFIVCRIYE